MTLDRDGTGFTVTFTSSSSLNLGTVTSASFDMTDVESVDPDALDPSQEADLSSLSVSQGSLQPGFTADTSSYRVKVSNHVASIGVTGQTLDSSASLTIGTMATASGSLRNVGLGVSETTIPILVTAAGGATRSYAVMVQRLQLGELAGIGMVVSDRLSADGERRRTAIGDIDRNDVQAAQPGVLNGHIFVDLEDVADDADIGLTAGAVRALQADNLTLTIYVSAGCMVVDGRTIDLDDIALFLNTPPHNLRLRAQIQQATAGQLAEARLSAQQQFGLAEGAVRVATVYHLVAENVVSGASIDLGEFGSRYVMRCFNIPDNPSGGQEVVGLSLDGEGRLRHVPTQMDPGRTNTALIRHYRLGTYLGAERRKVTFDDTSELWGQTAVRTLASRYIVHGVGDNRFELERLVTRAEAAALVARGLGILMNPTDRFDDVPGGTWYNGEVGAALQFDLVQGYGDRIFAPQASITRAEIAAITVRAIEGIIGAPMLIEPGVRNGVDGDPAIPVWAAGYLAKAVTAGLITLYPDGTVQSATPATRAEMATIILRTLKYLGFIDASDEQDSR
ncbi:MAG: S-layer homology domain-containing protein [Thermaerobacterales bacterium]